MWVHQIKTPISALQILLQTSETSEKITPVAVREMKLELFKIEQYRRLHRQQRNAHEIDRSIYQDRQSIFFIDRTHLFLFTDIRVYL